MVCAVSPFTHTLHSGVLAVGIMEEALNCAGLGLGFQRQTEITLVVPAKRLSIVVWVASPCR